MLFRPAVNEVGRANVKDTEEEEGNVRNKQTDGQTDRQTDSGVTN